MKDHPSVVQCRIVALNSDDAGAQPHGIYGRRSTAARLGGGLSFLERIRRMHGRRGWILDHGY